MVLLNIIFHRSPFSEPSVERCESFAAYCYDHIKFLTESFDGLSESAASFLADNVFCEVNPDNDKKSRITPLEFAEWVKKLPDHLLASSSGSRNVSGYSEMMTMPLEHSRTNSMASTLPSLLSSPRMRNSDLYRSSPSQLANEEDLDEEKPTTIFRSETPDDLPTPSFSPVPPPLANEAEDDEAEEMLRDEQRVDEELGAGDVKSADRSKPIPINLDGTGLSDFHPNEQISSGSEKDVQRPEVIDLGDPNVLSPEPSEGDADSVRQPLSAASSNPKRRKRGARKGRTAAKLEQKQELKRSQSVGQLSSLEDRGSRRHDRDAVIAELAAASQTLAREMSKSTKERSLSHSGSNSSLSKATTSSSSRASFLAPLATIPPFVKGPRPSLVESPTSQLRHLPDSKAPSNGTGSSSSTSSNFSRERSRGSTSNSTTSPVSRGQSGEGAESLLHDSTGSKWDSAASRRERMSAQRSNGSTGLGGPTLQDSGRSKPISWRERNQSTNTISSIASTNTLSSISSFSSDGSTYSTASAPAALARKSESSSRHRSRGGLGTIDEKQNRKEIDATYLATVFGGNPEKPHHLPIRRGDKGKGREAPSARKNTSSSNLSFISQSTATSADDHPTTPVRKEALESRQPSSQQASPPPNTESSIETPIDPITISKRNNPSGLAKFLRSVRSYNSSSNT